VTPSQEANLLVFRETRAEVSTQTLVQELAARISGPVQTRQELIDALIRAGELECALLDAGVQDAKIVAGLTDDLSALLVEPKLMSHINVQDLLSQITGLEMPSSVLLSAPEGFAYYALHPSDFVDVAVHVQTESPVAVIGIRSIGTALSAVFAAELKSRGYAASRITVRPTGHPYGRVTDFSREQVQWVHEHARFSRFFVVDEGPGLSGSSFLSVGEALVAHGISADRITLIGTREADPPRLYAHDGETRWGRFTHETARSSFYERLHLGSSIGGGIWRRVFLKADHEWPPCWPQMERVKFLSPDGNFLFKFDGLGRFGDDVRERADCLSRARIGPPVEYAGDGLTAYTFLPGQPLNRSEISSSIVERMGRYCAVRAHELSSTRNPQNGLAEMVRHNLQQELGISLELDPEGFQSSASVIADGHMQPEEWISTRKNEMLKVDAATHGDDHFLPGPVDIAWDLAGAIVEWDLTRDAQELLVATFKRVSGGDPRKVLPNFLLAYAVFRLAYSKMAMLALQGSPEDSKWRQACEFYQKRVMSELRSDQFKVNLPSTLLRRIHVPRHRRGRNL
jgi:hypothetical protein